MSTSLYPRLPRGPVVDANGHFTPEAERYFAALAQGASGVITREGRIQPTAPILNRTEGIGTTVSQHDATGKLVSTDAIAADGTGSPLTGGKRGFITIDTNNRLADSFRMNVVDASGIVVGASPLSASTGGSPNTASIAIAAATLQFGSGTRSYNSGSVSALNDGAKYYIYADDPNFAGGAVIYVASTSAPDVFANKSRAYFGSVTTPAFGGGGTSGSGGGSGGGRQFL